MTRFIPPGATLGVMGGGQLARMFVHAAQQMGYSTAVLDADPTSPAGLVAHHHIRADYLDAAGLAQLADVSAATAARPPRAERPRAAVDEGENARMTDLRPMTVDEHR